jgi:hypothetical protein
MSIKYEGNPNAEEAIKIDDAYLESVMSFHHMGSTISSQENVDVIKQRLDKTNAAYNTLQNIWRSKIYSTNSKIGISK